MSLMLANVRDRVGEIGLRRALGARARDVAALFVLEACLVTLAAAAAGGHGRGRGGGLGRRRLGGGCFDGGGIDGIVRAHGENLGCCAATSIAHPT